MSYRTLALMNIAIIGSGEVADTYAAGFACAGHHVYLARKEGDEMAPSRLLTSFDNVEQYSIEYAAAMADLILIATPPRDVREVSYWLGDVRRKVIIDATCNVHAPEEELVKTMCAIRSITGSPHIVKAFHTSGYEQLLKPIFGNTKVEMILAGNSKKAKEITKIIAKELDINNCYDFGGDETFPLFNEMTKCWRKLVKKNAQETMPLNAIKR